MRYEAYAEPRVEFCWKRDWRILTEEFEFRPDVAGLVLPGKARADSLIEAHQEQQEWMIHEYAQVIDRALA